jgi:peptide deformylase
MPSEIFLVTNKKQEKILRKRTDNFDFKKNTKQEIAGLINRMRRIMREANGIGLSANQIGLSFRVFVAEVPDAKGGTKFYAVFNPKLEKISEEVSEQEEGCLSVPGRWGHVLRADKVLLSGQDKTGKPIKIKAWGLLAQVFQHEIDHLNGKLFIDRTKKVYTAEKSIS